MAKSKSVAKRTRQSEKRRVRNRADRSRIKTLTRKLRSSEDQEESQVLLKQVVSAYDKAARRGIVHPRTAARKKSALMKQTGRVAEKPAAKS